MRLKTAALAVATVTLFFGAMSNNANAQSGLTTLPIWVYYVDVTRAHFGSVEVGVMTWGPYNSYEEAFAKAEELEATLTGGPTVGYGDPEIRRAINPVLLQPIQYVGRRLVPQLPGLGR